MGGAQKLEKLSVLKVDETLGLVFGWAIICKENGEDYYDLNVDRDGDLKGKRVPEHIPEDEMLKAALDFSDTAMPGNDMHKGPNQGHYPFVFPLSTDIAKSLGISTEKTGLLVCYKPPREIFEKYASGEYTGFSIEGWHENSELFDAAA